MATLDDTTVDLETAALAVAEQRLSLLIYSRDGVRALPLVPGRRVVIGRAPPADVSLRDASISRQHAALSQIGGEVWIEDLGSTNGTRVNGAPIEGRHSVQPGDEVVLGSVLVSLHQLGPAEPELEGLCGHDQLQLLLEHDLSRASYFGRPLALLMVQDQGGREGDRVGRWVPRVQRWLRSVDRAALYEPRTLEVALAEPTAEQVRALAEGLVDGVAAADQETAEEGTADDEMEGAEANEVRLRVGVATFPESATSAEGLIAAARSALRRATASAPLVEAPSLAHGPVRRGDGEGGRPAPVVASPAMEAVYTLARRVARIDLPVLVTGETGTGKELVARAIHGQGPRAGGPLQVINCAAIPADLVQSVLFGHERGAFTDATGRVAGVFEQAAGGTLVLDEVGELSPAAQAALLRVLETKRVRRVGGSAEVDIDVRVVAATHRDLELMCDEGSFRWDLYYRLNGVVLLVPPLRERPEEIPALVRAFLAGGGASERTVAPAAMEVLARYDWPGNVRQLRNVIERAAALARGEVITVDDLPERVRSLGMSDTVVGRARPTPAGVGGAPAVESGEPSPPFRERVRRFEAALLLDALHRSGWNQAKAARLLGTTPRAVYHKCGVHGLRQGSEEVARLERQLSSLLGLTFADGGGARESFKEQIRRYEVELLEQALLASGFNKAQAARQLRIPLRTLVYKVGQYGITSPDE